MRVLWFTNTPSNFLEGINPYNGGGWISSLETEIQKRHDIQLGIAFLLNGNPQKVKREDVCYYSISNPFGGTKINKLRRILISEAKWQHFFLKEYMRIVEDFAPDIINIFGTEQDFGLITQYTQIPVIIHIQGLLIPCLSAYFPPSYNVYDFIFSNYNPIKTFKRLHAYIHFKKSSRREKVILQNNRHYLGRTNWDKDIISIYSPHATYDYCSEILRDVFYEPCFRIIPKRLKITTTISDSLYKGFDVVLKCASILKCQFNLDFEWCVYGNINPSLVEGKENVRSNDVNVYLKGVASPSELRDAILKSTLYVHPSYIDNSPNSICEAQILGCTVIAQNVGGIPSLIEEGKTGFLVPANDPYQMSCIIKKIYENPDLNRKVGAQGQLEARKRHNKDHIVETLIKIYQKYRNEKNNYV